jgi:hypothetical protein
MFDKKTLGKPGGWTGYRVAEQALRARGEDQPAATA